MVKTYLATSLAVVCLCVGADNAFASRRHRCWQQTQPACAAQTQAASVPATAQANGTSSYQSFSYEPGTSAAPASAPAQVTIAPAPQTKRSTSSFYDQVRGDRKVRGVFN